MDIYKYVMTAPEKSTLMLDEYQVEELRELVARLELINADLLAVCEELFRVMVSDFENMLMYSDGPDQAEAELFEQLEAAIAKARGE